MSLPKTFKRAVFREASAPLTIEDATLELPGKGEVLVKVEACGVCFSDTMAQINLLGGGFPLVPGHEIIGRIAALGEGVTGWSVGDRVGGGWHGGHDGTCKACTKGLFQMCDNAAVNGETRNGGYAEFTLLSSTCLISIPASLSASTYAPILCAGVSIFNSIRQAQIPAGSTVAIQGLGGLGHLGIQYAAKCGYRVIAISRDASKEHFARQLGAHEYVDCSKTDPGEALRSLGGAVLVVATAPSKEGMGELVKGLSVLGKLVVLSVPGPVEFDTAIMLRYGLSVQMWPSGTPKDVEETIEFTQLQGVECMVETFPLEKANDAYNKMKDGSVRFRSVIVME